MAPQPKAPGARRRRNLGQAQWRQLPAEGTGRPAPELGVREDPGWLESTREWWTGIWASPMASAWLDSDVPELRRLASMVDTAARRPELAGLHTQISLLGDRFGLSPKGRRALQWEIAAPTEPARLEVAPPERKLRAV